MLRSAGASRVREGHKGNFSQIMGCWPFWRTAQPKHPAADKLVSMATKKLEQTAKYKKARKRAWTGSADVAQAAYKVGDKAFANNPHYKDGTRLRVGATKESEFNDHYILNDAEVVVLEVTESNEFARVRKADDAAVEGWMRQRNLRRRPGLAGVQPDPERRMGLERRSSEYRASLADSDAHVRG